MCFQRAHYTLAWNCNFDITFLLNNEKPCIHVLSGYILATFPVSDLFRSEYNREIISEIGSLSLCELMLVMPRSHLENITAAYITTFVSYIKLLFITLRRVLVDEKFVKIMTRNK